MNDGFNDRLRHDARPASVQRADDASEAKQPRIIDTVSLLFALRRAAKTHDFKPMQPFFTTFSGWAMRKGLELIAIGGASLGSYLTAHNVPESVATPGVAFAVAVGSWLLSLGLSRVADAANKALPPKK